ncbi:hypothetical protein Godav_003134, partial [Gossypium davidsonii]|nr:hypothetical protein [Gossypium davidsonii]
MGTTKLTQALLKNTKNPKLAWQLFKRIQSSPSNPCFLSSVPTIARILIRSKMLPEIDHLHLLLLSSQPQEKSLPSLISLVNLLAKSGFFDKAFSQFQSIRKIVVYNTLISSFCEEGKTGDVEKLVERMKEDGLFPDVVTFNARISALCSAGKVLEASRIFRDMQIDEALGLPRPNVITYN